MKYPFGIDECGVPLIGPCRFFASPFCDKNVQPDVVVKKGAMRTSSEDRNGHGL
jgi:hypothetical protein